MAGRRWLGIALVLGGCAAPQPQPKGLRAPAASPARAVSAAPSNGAVREDSQEEAPEAPVDAACVRLLDAGGEPRAPARYAFAPTQATKLVGSSKEALGFGERSALRFELRVEAPSEGDEAAGPDSLTLVLTQSAERKAALIGAPVSTRATFDPRASEFSWNFSDPRTALLVRRFSPLPLLVPWPEAAIGVGARWQRELPADHPMFESISLTYVLLDRDEHAVLVGAELRMETDTAKLLEHLNDDGDEDENDIDEDLVGDLSVVMPALYQLRLDRPELTIASAVNADRLGSGSLLGSETWSLVAARETRTRAPAYLSEEPLRRALARPESGPFLSQLLARLGDRRAQRVLLECAQGANVDRARDCHLALSGMTQRKLRGSEDRVEAAEAFAEAGQFEEALDVLEAGLAAASVPERARLLVRAASIHQRSGDLAAADRGYRRAVELEPVQPEALAALAYWRATAPERRYRNPAQALELALELGRTAAPDSRHLRVIAAAYAARGEVQRAAALQSLAVEGLGYRDITTREQWRDELDQYESGRPWIQPRPGALTSAARAE